MIPIPITRKDHYLNEIVGNDDYDIPEKPIPEEELFFAEILGEAVQAPEPLPRYQMYLAKIAGRDIEIPYPETRLEYFLAKAAGMDITVPVPITREEIYWSNYTAIVEFEVENVPPLTYKAIEGTLKNYRIYGNTETKTRSYSGSAPLNFPIVDGSVSNYRIHGNTENGESVGGLVTDSQSEHYGKYAIPITNNSETSNIYLDEPLRKVGDEAEYVDYAEQKWHRVRKNLANNKHTRSHVNYTITENDNYIHVVGTNTTSGVQGIILSNFVDLEAGEYDLVNNSSSSINVDYYDENGIAKYFNVLSNSIKTFTYPSNVTRALNVYTAIAAGRSIDAYFQVMIVKHGNDTTIYEPYIENTEVDVTVPALPSQSSTNSLSVGTAVQPSSLAVDVDEVVSCGDKVTDSQSVNYGKYKIHVTLTADSTETTDIYLDEPLAKSGNNTDYIDYATQKRHNSDGTESSVTLPEISTLAGTNTLSVGTEVQPSKVYIKGEKEREYI